MKYTIYICIEKTDEICIQIISYCNVILLYVEDKIFFSSMFGSEKVQKFIKLCKFDEIDSKRLYY